MPSDNCLRLALVLFVATASILTPLPNTWTYAQTIQHGKPAQATPPASDFAARLARMEAVVEAKRKELGVPGMSLVVIKDDRVVYLRGFGLRDVEHTSPVTPDTLFPIGSSTKALTAMLAMMSDDDGKLSLEDSPKKYLPYFKLQDPEADRRITLRDLMRHNSGLARTEALWYPGVLAREEVIRAVGFAKPTAPLGKRFQYQNVMYAAAGEMVARAQNSTWERLMTERLLRPLGMKRTTLSLPAMLRAPDYALGYQYNPETKELKRLPFRSESALASVAPAGALYSNAREMAEWLRLMLGGGVYAGKRLVSEKNFAELVSPQFKNIGGSGVDYGLGWYLLNRKGRRVVQHGGSIDGFRAQISMMPEERLGFAILTNSYHTPLVASDLGGGQAEEIIWSNLVDELQTNRNGATGAHAADPQQEIGKYSLAAANLTIEVTIKDGRLVLNVPGQPPYTLENVGGRRYKFADPAPAGYFVTFRPAGTDAAKTEMFLQQPQPKRDVVLTKVNPEAESTVGENAANYKEFIGSYEAEYEGKKLVFQLTIQDGKLTVLRPGQRSLTLVEKGKDTFAIAGAPASYEMVIERDPGGEVTGLLAKQPNGDTRLKRVAVSKLPLSAEELMTRVIGALGGEVALRKHKTRVETFDINFVNQGITGTGTVSAKAPYSTSTEITLTALGKRLGTIHEYFDGTTGGTESSFLLPATKTDMEIAQERIMSDFYAPLGWREKFKTIVIEGVTKVGDEEAYIVVKTPQGGVPVTDYVSTKSYLLLRRDDQTRVSRYSDYREVDGAMMPFKWIVETPNTGEQVVTVKTVRFEVDVPDTLFGAQPHKGKLKTAIVGH